MKGPSRARRITLVLLTLPWLSLPAIAQGPEPPFKHDVFAPELVMKQHREIGLRDDQREAITEAIQHTQAATVELHWAMQDAVVELTREMEKDRIDEKAALATAERLMSIEGRVKRAHLALLIQIKNQLDPAQQTRLKALRASGD
jgi:Spy/CpxP family protein refolding chaperone